MELEVIQNKIFEIRGNKVMLDFDLSLLYGVETRVLKQSIRRNLKRFPEDFMFELSDLEINRLVSQNVIPSKMLFRWFFSFCLYRTRYCNVIKCFKK
jgi:hypothetical protein